MFYKYHKVLFFLLFFNLLWVLFPLTACSSGKSSSGTTKENSSSAKTVRPNEPDLHIPKASGTSVIGQGLCDGLLFGNIRKSKYPVNWTG